MIFSLLVKNEKPPEGFIRTWKWCLITPEKELGWKGVGGMLGDSFSLKNCLENLSFAISSLFMDVPIQTILIAALTIT